MFTSCGASAIWAVDLKYPATSAEPLLDLSNRIAVDRPICPALHLKKGDPIELSVCGKRNDRLILVMGYFHKLCLADYESCPYWRGEYNDC